METQVWVTLMAKWAGEGKYWTQEVTKNAEERGEMIVSFLNMTRQLTKHLVEKVDESPDKELGQLAPLVLEVPGRSEEVQVQIKRDSMTEVDWINARERTARGAMWRQNTSPDAAHTHIFLVARRVAQCSICTIHALHLHWLTA